QAECCLIDIDSPFRYSRAGYLADGAASVRTLAAGQYFSQRLAQGFRVPGDDLGRPPPFEPLPDISHVDGYNGKVTGERLLDDGRRAFRIAGQQETVSRIHHQWNRLGRNAPIEHHKPDVSAYAPRAIYRGL